MAPRDVVHSPARRIDVFVLDPTPLMRIALRRVIEEAAGFSWVGESAEPEHGIQEIGRLQPGIALIDIAFADQSGIELIHSIRAAGPKTQIVVFTSMAGTVYGDRCLRAGAVGFVSKKQTTTTLVQALGRASDGGIWIDEDLASQLLNRQRNNVRDPVDSLSSMEFEVFRQIAEGHTSTAIANRLHRSVRTIETYRHRIKMKLDLANATELAQFAMRCLLEWPTGSSPTLPHAAPATATREARPAIASTLTHSVAEADRELALIIEDNVPTSGALAVTCRRLGYRTEVVRSVEDAFAKLGETPDVILLDLRLASGDDGTEVLRKVRKDKLPAQVAVVTGIDDVDALDKVLQLAPEVVFRKPLRFSDLEQWLLAARKTLDESRKSTKP